MIPHDGVLLFRVRDARSYLKLVIASIMGGLASGFRPVLKDRDGYKSGPPIDPAPKLLLSERVIPSRRGKRIDPALALARFVAIRTAEKRAIRDARKRRKYILGLFARLCVKHRVSPRLPQLSRVRALAFQ